MKLIRLIILPLLFFTLMSLQTGHAVAANAEVGNPNGAPGHDTRHQWLVNTIDHYAPVDLANQMKKDLSTHHQLLNKLRQTASFQQQQQKCLKKRQAFHEKHAEQIRSIKKEQEQGKISANEAHHKIGKLFNHSKFRHHHKAFEDLRTAIKLNDKQAIVKALEAIDQHVQQSNQRLTKKLSKTSHK